MDRKKIVVFTMANTSELAVAVAPEFGDRALVDLLVKMSKSSFLVFKGNDGALEAVNIPNITHITVEETAESVAVYDEIILV